MLTLRRLLSMRVGGGRIVGDAKHTFSPTMRSLALHSQGAITVRLCESVRSLERYAFTTMELDVLVRKHKLILPALTSFGVKTRS